jgi:serine/threonine-protein kinase HipA
VRNTLAGVLKETDAGYSFVYDKEYISKENPSAVSLTLPIQEEEYTSKTLFSFFDGLIPEGWLLNVVTNNWKIDRNDRFGLLLVACKDPIGNVSIKGAEE